MYKLVDFYSCIGTETSIIYNISLFQYLYLIFSDDNLISLDQWVFNTEAHPLPIKGMNLFYRPSISLQNEDNYEAV